MENCISKSDNSLEIIKKAYQPLFLAQERLADVVYGSEDERGEDKLKKIPDKIDELCKEYPWLCELGREYMISNI